MEIDREALDRHITGNYGEDQFDNSEYEYDECFICSRETLTAQCEKCNSKICADCYEEHFGICKCGVQ